MGWSSNDSQDGEGGNSAARGGQGAAAGSSIRPFIKWAGGKTQLLPQLKPRFPQSYKRYWEPFIGGGAMFFAITPQSATLIDINEELINTYRVVRDDVDALIGQLQGFKYDKEQFYQVREWDRCPDFKSRPAVLRAARFIYLNRTCFNGLHRVNSKGYFNVPFGRYSNPKIADADCLKRCSRALRGAKLEVGSYTSIAGRVERGDLVYFDPPYVPLSDTSSFTAYAKDGFNAADQVALRDLCVDLDRKGVMFILSNSANDTTHQLYRDFRCAIVPAGRAINANASMRGDVDELIVTNFAS